MKKVIAITITITLMFMLMFMLSMTSCGGGQDSADTGAEVAEENDITMEEPEEIPEEESSEALLSPEFKKTMDDYEDWFDHYCEVMKKYQENPSDLALLSEMTDLITEETEMLDQMNSMDQSEMNTAELAYYIEVTARIEKKLLEVIDY